MPQSAWKPGGAKIRIEAHPYCQGYWKRYFGIDRPERPEEQQGWDGCDEDLAFEVHQAAGGKPDDFTYTPQS